MSNRLRSVACRGVAVQLCLGLSRRGHATVVTVQSVCAARHKFVSGRRVRLTQPHLASVAVPHRCYRSSPLFMSTGTDGSRYRRPGSFPNDATPSSQYFDLQDVDADKLTSYYWDLDSAGMSPYSYEFMDEDMNGMSECADEPIDFVNMTDRELLKREYL